MVYICVVINFKRLTSVNIRYEVSDTINVRLVCDKNCKTGMFSCDCSGHML